LFFRIYKNLESLPSKLERENFLFEEYVKHLLESNFDRQEAFVIASQQFRPSEKLKKKHSEIKKSQMTPEKRELLRQISLSNGSMPPSQKGKHRWTNGKENKMCTDCPGEGWYRGVTKNRKSRLCTGFRSSIQNRYLDFQT
jgi:hypothetical protein